MRGKGWEKDLAKVFAELERYRVLIMRKTDPPVRFIGPGKIIFTENPFLDFAGAWTEAHGKALLLEAKQTEKPQLHLGGKSNAHGVTGTQLRNLRVWRAAGALTGILWRTIGGDFLIPTRAIPYTGLKHLKAQECLKWRIGERISAANLRSKLLEIWPNFV